MPRAPSTGSFTVANMFWWFNMYSTVDYAVTPRPMYPADGRKVPDVHTNPGTLRSELQAVLGTLSPVRVLGTADVDSVLGVDCGAPRRSSKGKYNPTLTLVYLPHLDYNLQRFGVSSERIGADLADIERVTMDLVGVLRGARRSGHRAVGVRAHGRVHARAPQSGCSANTACSPSAMSSDARCWIPAQSAAFAVADHQVAHVYVNDQRRLADVRAPPEWTSRALTPSWDRTRRRAHRLDHPRAGDLVAVATPDAWFTYYYWIEDERAPDYARTVDIHRKPGYDPVELFLDPAICRCRLVSVGWKLAKRAAGFRTLLDVIPARRHARPRLAWPLRRLGSRRPAHREPLGRPPWRRPSDVRGRARRDPASHFRGSLMLTLYLLIKLVHVFAAIVAVGTNITYGVWIASRQKRNPGALPFALRWREVPRRPCRQSVLRTCSCSPASAWSACRTCR